MMKSVLAVIITCCIAFAAHAQGQADQKAKPTCENPPTKKAAAYCKKVREQTPFPISLLREFDSEGPIEDYCRDVCYMCSQGTGGVSACKECDACGGIHVLEP